MLVLASFALLPQVSTIAKAQDQDNGSLRIGSSRGQIRIKIKIKVRILPAA